MSSLPHGDVAKMATTSALTIINKKPLYYRTMGSITQQPVVFVHGLGGTNNSFMPLIDQLDLEQSHSLHLFDFEGHGLSPTSPLSKLSVDSLAMDLDGIFEHANIASGATLIAHDMGCLIAVQFMLRHPDKVSKLVILSPPSSPLSSTDSQKLYTYANIARRDGMLAVADKSMMGIDPRGMKTSNPLTAMALRLSLLSQNPEGYAKACKAFTEAPNLDIADIESETLIITGSEDMASSPDICTAYSNAIRGRSSVHIVDDVGHCAILENTAGVAKVVAEFLGEGKLREPLLHST
jgi:pimeloyl-ACP methyl ester carboxylesterase